MNPAGKVPVLRYRDECRTESEQLMRYIDKFNGKPETSLLNVCGEEDFRSALSLSDEVSYFPPSCSFGCSTFGIRSLLNI